MPLLGQLRAKVLKGFALWARACQNFERVRTSGEYLQMVRTFGHMLAQTSKGFALLARIRKGFVLLNKFAQGSHFWVWPCQLLGRVRTCGHLFQRVRVFLYFLASA